MLLHYHCYAKHCCTDDLSSLFGKSAIVFRVIAKPRSKSNRNPNLI